MRLNRLDVAGEALKVSEPPCLPKPTDSPPFARPGLRRASSPKRSGFSRPKPFAIDEKNRADLERLGHQLFVFQRACNQLYQQSVKGKQPAWVARYLDLGKPAELIEFSRRKEFRDDIPRVIRPDLVLTDEGWTIAEVDSVPGGIGLTRG